MSSSQFQTVVVGVDFSDYSKIAVKQALCLAEQQKAQLVFVHTLNNMALMTDELFVDVEDEFVKPLAREITSFYKLNKVAPQARIVVNLGRPSDGIIAVARGTANPIIVVGHRGKGTFMGRVFIGSAAEQLALSSPFPVWIHRGNTVRAPKRILLPCDFSARAADSLSLAKSLNGSLKTKYEFFHVTQRPVPFLDAVQWKLMMDKIRREEAIHQQKFCEQFPKIPFVKKLGDPASLIAKESKKFDLIAMAPHSREGIFSGFGSVTTKIVRQGNTPILIAHRGHFVSELSR